MPVTFMSKKVGVDHTHFTNDQDYKPENIESMYDLKVIEYTIKVNGVMLLAKTYSGESFVGCFETTTVFTPASSGGKFLKIAESAEADHYLYIDHYKLGEVPF